MAKTRRITVSVSLDPDIAEYLAKMAKAEHRTKSMMIELLIRQERDKKVFNRMSEGS